MGMTFEKNIEKEAVKSGSAKPARQKKTVVDLLRNRINELEDEISELNARIESLESTPNSVRLESIRKTVRELREKIAEMDYQRPPRIGWISQKDFCMMVGRIGKDGKKIPINRTTFHNMVKGSNGAIEIIKINNGVWVTKYPGQPQYDKSEAA